jgi:transposase
MSKGVNFVGVDVSSKELVTCIKRHNKTETELLVFENTIAGHKKLIKAVTKYSSTAKICLESTGVYHIEMALKLAKHEKTQVMVVNPKAMHNFATAMLQRAKTDKYDAKVILEYALRMDFLEWTAPKDAYVSLHRFVRRIMQIKKTKVQEQSRQKANEYQGRDAAIIRKTFKQIIATCDKQIASITKQCIEIIKQDDDLAAKFEILKTVTGIAEKSAITILAEIIMLPSDLAASQWVAYAGLDPKPVESGTSIKKPRRISKHGNKYIRSALYMPALVAIQYDENIAAYYQMLIAKGKKKMQALVAVMRKLLIAIWGILNNKEKWDGNKFYKLPIKG